MAASQTPQATKLIPGVAEIVGEKVNYTQEIPEDVVDKVPAILLRGYLAQEEDYVGLRQNIASLLGKTAITFESTSSLVNLSNPLRLLNGGIPESQAAYGVLRTEREDDENKKYDVIAHSLGGYNAVSLAMLKPEYIRSCIFMASVGLANHSLPQMLGRCAPFLGHDLPDALDELYENKVLLAKDGAKRVVNIYTNFFRTVREGKIAATCNIQDRVSKLRDRGISTAALQFEYDTFSPPSEVDGLDHLFDDVRILEGDPAYNHLAPQTRPSDVSIALGRTLLAINTDREEYLPIAA